jgi:hypothetical protein
MLVCSICQKKIIKDGQMVSEERVTPQTKISRQAHIYIERYDLGRYDIVMGKDYTPFARDKNRCSQNRSLYEVQKEILCIPYQKNIIVG